MNMLHISLFSGIGGFDLASEWMGWQNIVSCEINPFSRKILQYYWPNSYHHDDIHTLTYDTINTELTRRFGTRWRNNDIVVTGGFPCQPYSLAGKRKGKDDDRHLWPEMLRAIREIQPTWVVGENVRGLINWNGGMVFDEVQADLETEGYEVIPFILPACGVNAPHRRDRVWFVAYAKLCSNRLSTTGRVDMERTILERREWGKEADGFGIVSTDGPTPHTDCNGLNGSDCQHEVNASEGGKYAQRDLEQGIGDGYAADADDKRLERKTANGNMAGQQRFMFGGEQMGKQWQNFPTQSPVCNGDDGLSTRLDGITFPKWRNESIKAAGNAVVPQVVFQIFKAIQAVNDASGQSKR